MTDFIRAVATPMTFLGELYEKRTFRSDFNVTNGPEIAFGNAIFSDCWFKSAKKGKSARPHAPPPHNAPDPRHLPLGGPRTLFAVHDLDRSIAPEPNEVFSLFCGCDPSLTPNKG